MSTFILVNVYRAAERNVNFPLFSIAEKLTMLKKIFGVQRELNVEKKIVCNNAMKFLHKGMWFIEDKVTHELLI